MAEIKNIRLLTAAEIECRIATVNEKGLSLLLFKDARVDQKILDETYTPFGWRRSHQSIDGNLYCTVEVWDESKKQWVGKQDVGTMSYSEKEKGQASDSFKRACFNWGIGRELYTAPFIWVPATMAKVYAKGDRYVSNEHFSVKAISYNENREIASLEIVDSKGQSVFSMQQSRKNRQMQNQSQGQNKNQDRSKGISKASEVVLMAELNRTGVALETVLERYGLTDISQMTPDICGKAVAALKRTESKTGAVKESGTAA